MWPFIDSKRTHYEAKTRRQRVALFKLDWECGCQATQNFHCSEHVCVCDHESNMTIDFGYKEIITKRKTHKDGICI